MKKIILILLFLPIAFAHIVNIKEFEVVCPPSKFVVQTGSEILLTIKAKYKGTLNDFPLSYKIDHSKGLEILPLGDKKIFNPNEEKIFYITVKVYSMPLDKEGHYIYINFEVPAPFSPPEPCKINIEASSKTLGFFDFKIFLLTALLFSLLFLLLKYKNLKLLH